MKKSSVIFLILPMCIIFSSGAAVLPPETAIKNVRENCGTISQTFKSMKTMAAVNTAITGVGTAAGAGATAVGISKAKLDNEIEKLIQDARQREGRDGTTNMNVDERVDFINNTLSYVEDAGKTYDTQDDKEQRSKNLGNWRTGLLAANTATNIAGTVIAVNNGVSQDLRTQLANCVSAISDLQNSKMQARIDNADSAVLKQMDDIITACRDYDTLDISKIDNRAKGAAVSSGAGIAVGAAGTIASAVANSKKIREPDDAASVAKEKNLNTASNILAAGATVASGVATVFNATQISTLKQAQKIATQCSEALNQ